MHATRWGCLASPPMSNGRATSTHGKAHEHDSLSPYASDARRDTARDARVYTGSRRGVSRVSIPPRARASRSSRHHIEPLYGMVQQRRAERAADPGVRRPVFGVLEPV